MKKDIHPKYVDTQVTCGCGNKFTTKATRPELKVDICNVCHPFYTGKLKFVDTAGRIDKFNKKFAGANYGGKKQTVVNNDQGTSNNTKIFAQPFAFFAASGGLTPQG